MDLNVMNVERLSVLRRVACEFEERMLDLRVPFILQDARSVIVLSCGLYNVAYLAVSSSLVKCFKRG
jgi:hypothetical protein